MKSKRSSSVVFVLALSLAGCSEGASSGAPGSGNDLAAKKLSDLTPAELGAFCSRNQDALASIVSGSCALVGLDAPSRAECDTAVSECRSSGASTACGGDGGVADFSDCGLKIGTAESCLADAKSYFSTLGCDAFGQAPSLAPSCLATIEASCPALLGAE